MNIGIVTTWFERGAAYVSRQFMELLQKTDDVFIYARAGEAYAKDNPRWNLNNVHWGSRNEGKLAILGTYIDRKDFERWIKKNNIQAILFNEQNWLTPILWCKALGVKAIAYVDYYNSLTIPLFNCYDALICNTKRHAFAFRNHPNVNYLKWGTNLDVYKPSEEKHERVTFFNSAGMDPKRKGTDFTIRAFYNLKNRISARLVIHSQLSLAKECPDLTDIIKEMQDEGTLEIYEKTVPAPGLYYKGDVYVYPSRLDGIGLTLMEAIASGMACITVDNGPMNEFIEKDFGRLCKVDYFHSRFDGYYWPMCEADVESLTEQMEYFLSPECDLNAMKIAARQYAENELDFSKNISPLSELIRNCKYTPVSTDLTKEILFHENRGIKKFANALAPLYSLNHLIKTINVH